MSEILSRNVRQQLGLAVRETLVWMLASPAGVLGSSAVSRIPRLWEKLLLKPVLPPLKAAGIAALKQWAPMYPDSARIQFSLALRYLDAVGPVADRRALACLRSSQWLDFESVERLSLYRAVLASRAGDIASAQAHCADLKPQDLSSEEQLLLENALQNNGGAIRRCAPEPACPERPKSILAVGDLQGISAGWFAETSYLLVCPEVNGLSVQWCANRREAFDVAFGSSEAKRQAVEAGIRFVAWHEVDFPS